MSLADLLTQTTPGPWAVRQVQHHWNDYSYTVDGAAGERLTELADARLVALAPDLAKLAIDMAAKVAELREHTKPAPVIGDAYLGWHETYWRIMGELDELLAAFAALNQRATT